MKWIIHVSAPRLAVQTPSLYDKATVTTTYVKNYLLLVSIQNLTSADF